MKIRSLLQTLTNIVIFAGPAPPLTPAPTCVHLELVPPGQLQCDKIAAMCAVEGELYVVFVGKESSVFVYGIEAARLQLLEQSAGQRSDDRVRLQATRGVDITNRENDALRGQEHPAGTIEILSIKVGNRR